MHGKRSNRLITSGERYCRNMHACLLRFPASDETRWEDGWRLSADDESLRGVRWCYRAMRAACSRCIGARKIAFDQWTAAVEAVWWAVALDDVLYGLHDDRYKVERSNTADGRTVLGLRWLRHQHTHEMVVTGHGGPKRSFIDPERGGPPFFISPDNRWRARTDMPAPR